MDRSVTHVVPGQRQPVDIRPALFSPRDEMIDWHEAEELRAYARLDIPTANRHALHAARLEALDRLASRLAHSAHDSTSA